MNEGITVAGQLPIYTEFPDSEIIGVTNINYVKERKLVKNILYKIRKVNFFKKESHWMVLATVNGTWRRLFLLTDLEIQLHVIKK